MVMQFDEHEVESGVPGPVFPSGWHRSRRTRPTVRSWRHAVRSLQLDKGRGAVGRGNAHVWSLLTATMIGVSRVVRRPPPSASSRDEAAAR